MNNQKEPLIHISKRGPLPWYMAWLIRGCAVLAALLLCAVVTTLVTGENPLSLYATMYAPLHSFRNTQSPRHCPSVRYGRYLLWIS